MTFELFALGVALGCLAPSIWLLRQSGKALAEANAFCRELGRRSAHSRAYAHAMNQSPFED